jgi:hypothetical protein
MPSWRFRTRTRAPRRSTGSSSRPIRTPSGIYIIICITRQFICRWKILRKPPNLGLRDCATFHHVIFYGSEKCCENFREPPKKSAARNFSAPEKKCLRKNSVRGPSCRARGGPPPHGNLQPALRTLRCRPPGWGAGRPDGLPMTCPDCPGTRVGLIDRTDIQQITQVVQIMNG